jgi:tRNA(Arg) A34 adenosine deaminase TadA
MNNVHFDFMRQAIALAQQARANGDHPFGALLVQDGKVVCTAVNTVNTYHDCTHHAELNLVSKAARQFLPDVLAELVLYTSTEPCVMCAGAIFWAGIRTVVYGCPAKVLGHIAGDIFVIPSREIFARAKETTQVIGPILEDEAVHVHEGFW